jgi:hypothetical protein
MLCDRKISLSFAADTALRPSITGTFRVKHFVKIVTLPTGYMHDYGLSRLPAEKKRKRKNSANTTGMD